MDYKELIELSKKAVAEWHESHEYYQAAALIAALCEATETLLAEREAAGWVSVEDRLPEANEIVRAKSDTAVATARRTESGLWLIKIGGQWRNWLSAITHWMPLPEPPK